MDWGTRSVVYWVGRGVYMIKPNIVYKDTTGMTNHVSINTCYLTKNLRFEVAYGDKC